MANKAETRRTPKGRGRVLSAAMAAALSELWRSEQPSQKSAERELFRPSRTNYPGSRFGPKTRYDLPQRHKAYGNGDETEAVVFSGSSLEPPAWAPAPLNKPGPERPLALLGSAGALSLTPRASAPIAGSRALVHLLAEKNLPELPLVSESNDVHGILVIGGLGAGKTSLILSMMSVLTGLYPSKRDPQLAEKLKTMPAHGGHCYELPYEHDVKLGEGVRRMRIILTDTPPCGSNQREEQPLCATVSPNSQQHYNAIPSWMRITLRSGNHPHYTVLIVVDAMAKPLWEDKPRCRDLARLLSVLIRSQYTVCIAVTKILQLRENAMRDVAHGSEHGGRVGQDPRSSYETFASRYMERVCAGLIAQAQENGWVLTRDPDRGGHSFPLVNVSVFDAPTWTSVLDYKAWQAKKGTLEVPNFRYYTSQLRRLLAALAVRSHAQ